MSEDAIELQRTEETVVRERFLYGILAEYDDADALVDAARRTREAGYRKFEAYAPFPVEGLPEAAGHRDLWVPTMMLVGGILGGVGGFSFLAWTMGVDYPVNIGGRPLIPWPSMIPITFEMTVLTAALVGVVGMFVINGLPAPYHPLFDDPNFSRATSDRFFLCIETKDLKFDRDETRRFLESLAPLRVAEVELRK